MKGKDFYAGVLFALTYSFAPSAAAVFIGNIQGGADFPAGAVSFADAVANYSSVITAGEPTLRHRDPRAPVRSGKDHVCHIIVPVGNRESLRHKLTHCREGGWHL